MTGGLNYQIEHHCFPRMSSAWYPYIQVCVRARAHVCMYACVCSSVCVCVFVWHSVSTWAACGEGGVCVRARARPLSLALFVRALSF